MEYLIDVFKEQKRNPFELTLKPYAIEVDKIGFEQMLDTIFSNAIKYTPKEAPIYVTFENGILTIEDRGGGMSETELLRVHERYYQADDKKDGEGIGLSLVKAYCEDEGIDIQITSQKGVGTTVTLNISKVHVGA